MKPAAAVATFGIPALILAASPANTDDNRAHQTLKQEIARLSARLSDLEKSKHRVSAPFEVVSMEGTVILRVGAIVGSTGNGARVTIGGGTNGNWGVRVFNDGGQPVAGIGESLNQLGGVAAVYQNGGEAAVMNGTDRSVSVYNNGGDTVARLISENDRGAIGVYDKNQPIAYLTKSDHGAGGNIATIGKGGTIAFHAGAASDGGGEACVHRVSSGGQRLACLGIGLPGMGSGQ